MAGEANQAVNELWDGKIRRALNAIDGFRRAADVAAIIEEVEHAGQRRHMIFPGRDPRVLRIIRKITRGLVHHHGLGTGVPDSAVWADVLRFELPSELFDGVDAFHQEPDVIRYWIDADQQQDYHSGWVFEFFERTRFIAVVSPW